VKRSILLVVLVLAAVAAAVAAPAAIPAASPAPAHLTVAQPAPVAAATTIGSKPPCFDFCSRAYCAQGTTCGANPKTGQCGCWPDDIFPTNPSTDPSSSL
jgi:hypothetical protein